MHKPPVAVKVMALHHALLSLLADGESYGYELKSAFERRAGPQWGELNIGHLYQVLERLKRDGLVRVVRAEPQPRRPDRLIYAITPAGRDELRRWLGAPSPPAAGYRDDLYLKLVAGAAAGKAELLAVVSRERQALLGELHALRELGAGADELAGLLTEGAALQVEAQLRLLDRAEDEAQALAAAVHAERPATPALANVRSRRAAADDQAGAGSG
jgi:DNA-binding PadR family transcriptional regulator